MVIQSSISARNARCAFVTAELFIAIGLLSVALLPLSYSFNHERQMARACYNRAIAMEIVDGEMEVLLAGEWRAFPEGAQNYPVHSGAVTNLPQGNFVLSRNEKTVRLEWVPTKRDKGGRVLREANLK